MNKRLVSKYVFLLVVELFVAAPWPVVAASEEPATAADEAMLTQPYQIEKHDEPSVQERHGFSLIACFNEANSNNKEIALAESNLPISEAAVVIAKAIPNPTFNMIYGFGPAWAYIIAGNNQQIGWNEEVQVAGKRTKKTNLARSNYLQTAFEVEAVRFDVHNRVRRAYAELMMANAYAKLTHVQEDVFEKLFSIAQKRYIAGKAPGSEVLQAKLNLMQLVTQHSAARSRLVTDSAQLDFLLGESPKSEEIFVADNLDLYNLIAGRSDIVPPPDRGVPALSQLLPVAWRQRNDLKAAIQEAYCNRRALTLAKSQRIPDPFLGFNYLYSTYKPFQLQYFTPAPGAQKVPYQPGYMFTVAEETPIFYQYQGEVNQAKATWIQQLKENHQLRTQAAADIVSAYEALVVTITNLHKFQQELLPEALQAAHLSRRGYELGKTDLATAILAEQQYGQLAAAYFDCAVSYHNNWADLEKAVGIPLKL
jgi:outer membrane protein TolC